MKKPIILVVLILFGFLNGIFAQENIALNKPALQSSSQHYTYGASYAVDGDNGTMSTTKLETNPWWRVDLESEKYISKIKINYAGGSGNSPKVYVGNVASSDHSQYTYVGTIDNPTNSGIHTFEVNQSVQYVFIQNQASQELVSLFEVEVYEKENIAFNKDAVQSSTRAAGGEASRAVDGNTNTNWSSNSVTHTNQQSNPWWRVDLGKSYDISKINIYNRAEVPERLNGAKV